MGKATMGTCLKVTMVTLMVATPSATPNRKCCQFSVSDGEARNRYSSVTATLPAKVDLGNPKHIVG